jgi:hypothetical protein
LNDPLNESQAYRILHMMWLMFVSSERFGDRAVKKEGVLRWLKLSVVAEFFGV